MNTTTTPEQPTRPARQGRQIALQAALGSSVTLTALTGFAFAWFAVYFQFFGETADADDYLMAAGCYTAAAVVLLLGVVGLVAYRSPRWMVFVAGSVAALDVVLAFAARADSLTAEGSGYAPGGFWDGIGGVLATPWSWVLVVAGVLGGLRLSRGRGGPTRR